MSGKHYTDSLKGYDRDAFYAPAEAIKIAKSTAKAKFDENLDVAFNLGFHTAPHQHAGDYHWHVHVWPQVTTLAGFERGTGVMINVVSPEQAAETLRRVGAVTCCRNVSWRLPTFSGVAPGAAYFASTSSLSLTGV